MHHGEVDVTMESVVWNSFDLLNVQVVIDSLRHVLTPRVVDELAGPGLRV